MSELDDVESEIDNPCTKHPTPTLQSKSTFTVPLKEPNVERATDRTNVSVTFDERVSVVSIPSRSDYSKALKMHLWSNKHERRSNEARNMIEFEAEGFDWKNVIADERMYINQDGEKVHPIHICSNFNVPFQPPPNKSLIKPIPQRPLHPSTTGTGCWDPVSRPATPSPTESKQLSYTALSNQCCAYISASRLVSDN